MSLVFYAILVAVFAVVWSCILIDEDMIFGFYGKWIDRLPSKLSYPLGSCSYCFGGQVALWYYFFVDDYRPDNHVFFVSMTILFIHLILYLYERTNCQS